MEDENYYIGQGSFDYKKQIKRHFNGKGSTWTKAHLPRRIVEIVNIGRIAFNKAKKLENGYTIAYMRKYGWEKVRGGFLLS